MTKSEVSRLFKVDLGLSIGMIAFIICEYCVLAFTTGGSAGKPGTVGISDFVLLIALIFGCRATVNGWRVNKLFAAAGLVLAFGCLLAMKIPIYADILAIDLFGFTISVLVILIAAIMMAVALVKNKKAK